MSLFAQLATLPEALPCSHQSDNTAQLHITQGVTQKQYMTQVRVCTCRTTLLQVQTSKQKSNKWENI